ncbi:hypothetical protein ACLPJG_26640 [Pseudomonas aeruginosa]|jgi:hypothetical protein|uniref:Uncharacterized protein n=2 Tax=Pseudomonas TaxID=286 RepID=A0ABD4YLM0_9PSED|nr:MULTISPECIES: hypothetical protein [Pseudomonas]RFP99714.1 hypothetical protein D0O09_21120 [Pseudomonas putida]TXG95529.1 MAG: hypothetical protein E6R08_11460 [Nevskiaceae bacterium]AGZ38128.1 hypothetical protein PVLB_26957 [Pseudomonas sp. VLB120]MCF3157314.1 hypothetical protein [Pseudomonas juntendi]MDH0760461.1 hypothetical protein [Pseudomonas juntendi]
MQIFGVPLHSPQRADLARLVVTLALAIVGIALVMHFLDWNLAQSSGILVGASASAISTACGVELPKHGFRGLLVFGVILLCLVATMAGIDCLLS